MLPICPVHNSYINNVIDPQWQSLAYMVIGCICKLMRSVSVDVLAEKILFNRIRMDERIKNVRWWRLYQIYIDLFVFVRTCVAVVFPPRFWVVNRMVSVCICAAVIVFVVRQYICNVNLQWHDAVVVAIIVYEAGSTRSGIMYITIDFGN